MKRISAFFALTLCLMMSADVVKATDVYWHLQMKDGTVRLIPQQYVTKVDTIAGRRVVFTLTDETVYEVNLSEIEAMTETDELPPSPTFTSFGFKKKLNEQLTESHTKKSPDTRMDFTLEGIGKHLTPTFTLSDPRAKVIADGKEQVSKVDRRRFDDDVTYWVSTDGYRMLQNIVLTEEVWSEEVRGYPTREVALREDMLSTNAPSNHGDELRNLLDGDPATIFHSTWGTGAYTPLPLDEYAHIDIALDTPIRNFRFYHKGRNMGNYNPLEWKIYASHDGNEWSLMKVIGVADGLPQSVASAEYTSMVIAMGEPYEYLRFEETLAEHKNYIAISELRLYEITNEDGQEEVLEPSVLLQPATYKYEMVPFGTQYTVHVDWLADRVGVPKVYIDVDGGRNITSKTEYLHAAIRIDGVGMYDDMNEEVWIRGRGNSSWGYSKKPYRLKFDSKQKPFGLTKGKSWVLLANAQNGSMMTNAIGMKAARMVGTAGANHIVPVDLYLNGRYIGNYNFTESVGLKNNSIDINEELGVMFELDSYFDELYKFTSSPYSLPVNVKDPDLSEEPFRGNSSFYLSNFRNDFDALASSVSTGRNLLQQVDIDALCRFMLVNDLVLNFEIGHPKSTFLYKDHLSFSDSKYVFGPVWDLDWGYGYEESSQYFTTSATKSLLSKTGGDWKGSTFFLDMMNRDTTIKQYYHKVWEDFMEHNYQELLDFIDDYYAHAAKSLADDNTVWYTWHDYAASLGRAKTWLDQRTNYILGTLTSYDTSEYDSDPQADINGDGMLSIGDIVTLNCFNLDDEKAEFRFDKADMDHDGNITESDIDAVIDHIATYSQQITPAWRRPFSDVSVSLESFDIPLGGSPASVNVLLLPDIDVVDEEDIPEYTAIQFDIIRPQSLVIQDVEFDQAGSTHRAVISDIDENTTRILIYSDNNDPLPLYDVMARLLCTSGEVIPENQCSISLTNCIAAMSSGDEERIQSTSVQFSISSSIDNVVASYKVRGGTMLQVDAINPVALDIYTVNGILFNSINVPAGHTEIALPAGIYIVGKQKVVIK